MKLDEKRTKTIFDWCVKYCHECDLHDFAIDINYCKTQCLAYKISHLIYDGGESNVK